MDQQREQAVWQRVRGPGGLTAEEAVLPERLEALILEQQADAAMLQALSGRVRGAGRGALSRAAAGTRTQARELNTLHYLLTGRMLRLQTPPLPKAAPLPEALREACLRLRRSAQAFESLKAEFADYGEEFTRFAGQTHARSRTLLRLLGEQTRPGL